MDSLPEKKVFLAVALIVKNEAPRIVRTLNSVKKVIDCVIILDTGSEDDTIKIIKEWCSKREISLFLDQKPFVDFSFSRNQLLDFAFGKSEYLLLMDANDELRNGENILPFLRRNRDVSVFQVHLQWYEYGFLTDYYRLALIRNNNQELNKNLRYVGRVHEYLNIINEEYNKKYLSMFLPNAILYQDRKKDKSSNERLKKDVEMLLMDLQENPMDGRRWFFLGQTYTNLITKYISEKKVEEINKYRNNIIHCYEQNLVFSKTDDEYYITAMRLIKIYDYRKEFKFMLDLLEICCKKQERAEAHFYKAALFHTMKIYPESLKECLKACCYKFEDIANKYQIIQKEIYVRDRWNLLYDLGKKLNNEGICRSAIKNLGREPDPVNIPLEQMKI